jgi:hypothetical protein
MDYQLHKSPRREASLHVDVRQLQRATSMTRSAWAVFIANTHLMSPADKKEAQSNLSSLMRIGADLQQRSSAIKEGVEPVQADSSDEEMLRFMTLENDTLQGIIQSALHIVDRLHATNRMTEHQYRRVQRFYKAVIAMHSTLMKTFSAATRSLGETSLTSGVRR